MKHDVQCASVVLKTMTPKCHFSFNILGFSSSPFSLYTQKIAKFGWWEGAPSINQVTCFFFLWKWYVADITILQRTLIWVRKMGSCPIGATSPCLWTTCLCSWAPTPLVDSVVILSLSPLGKCKNYWLLKGRFSSKLASSQVKKKKWEGFEEAPLCVHHLRVKNWDLLIHYLFAKNLVNEWGELSIRGKCGE